MPISSSSVLIVAVVLGGSVLVATGLVRPRLQDGSFLVAIPRRSAPLLAFRHRDTWLLLGLLALLGWTVATALDRSGWEPGSGILIPAIFLAGLTGWALAISRVSGRWFIAASLVCTVALLLLFTPPRVTARLTTLTPEAVLQSLSSVTMTIPQLLLAGLCALVVVSALWTAWWAFRRRHGLAALLPLGSIMAVEVLNDTSPILYFLTALWLAAAATVLLRLNFVALKDRWRQRRVPRASDTGWNFGEVGSEAVVLILVLAFILPPLSSQDISSILVPGSVHTIDFHPFGIGVSSGPIGRPHVGYSETIHPGASLDARPQTVMYVSGQTDLLYPFWRGIALGGWDGTAWYQLSTGGDIVVRAGVHLASKQSVPRTDLPTNPRLVREITTTFQTVVPPSSLDATVFAAGEPLTVTGYPVTVRGILGSGPGTGPHFVTVDHVQLADNPRTPYTYTVTEMIAAADVASLRDAPADYPSWLDPYRSLYWGRVAPGYSTAGDQRIADLARSIVGTAGATNPYDKAKAIETWFLTGNRFSYTLSPPTAAAGVRPLDNFLFKTHRGYCQDFATAMAVMLRTLDIPARLVSGFGLGPYDDRTHRYQVNTTDAHTWVEVYFPGYGWIPFEPTPDGINSPIARPQTAAQIDQPVAGGGTTAPRRNPNQRLLEISANSTPDSGPDLGGVEKRLALIAIGIVLLLLLCAGLLVRWLLTPADVPQIWRRLLFLSDRLRVPRQPGDTPAELGARLSEAVPEIQPDVTTLATLYTRARYRRGGLSGLERIEARRSWLRLRKRYPALYARGIRTSGGATTRREEGGRAGNRGRGGRRRQADPARGE
ncbi:MAG TPA: transglutaminaseTgpA domain-containing protein [Candidatus Limnocylindrales bacterium]|nr:transglutaminaseTgpA domain-containing protein [Candidatus Limnocylindrales bacterium]